LLRPGAGEFSIFGNSTHSHKRDTHRMKGAQMD